MNHKHAIVIVSMAVLGFLSPYFSVSMFLFGIAVGMYFGTVLSEPVEE